MDEVALVIRLPKDKYAEIMNKYDTFSAEMKEWGLDAIKNGTVILEGQEDSKDADAVLKELHYASSRSANNQMYRIKQTHALISENKENSDAYNN